MVLVDSPSSSYLASNEVSLSWLDSMAAVASALGGLRAMLIMGRPIEGIRLTLRELSLGVTPAVSGAGDKVFIGGSTACFNKVLKLGLRFAKFKVPTVLSGPLGIILRARLSFEL